jgi:hypothetical protein
MGFFVVFLDIFNGFVFLELNIYIYIYSKISIFFLTKDLSILLIKDYEHNDLTS